MACTFLFFCLYLWRLVGVFGVETDEMTTIVVMEGDSFTLHTGNTEIQRDDLILWTFGPKDIHIAKINRAHSGIFHESDDGRFRDRLQLDNHTGSLTITNSSTEHSGLYKMEIVTENKVSIKPFSVTVYVSLSSPIINSCSPQNPSSSERSSSSKCVLLCSVMNVTQVTLSWYKGNSLLSSISVSNLNTTLSLHLEVEYQDNNTYSCVLNNPISSQTKDLNITDLCQPSTPPLKALDYAHTYGLTEAVIRLVVSALVGVAAVAVLVYDIRSRRL